MAEVTVRMLIGAERQRAIETIRANHYAHSVSSGKSHYFEYRGALIVFSIPANKNIAPFLLGRDTPPNSVWELTRLWAPNGHEPNLLTAALSKAIGAFRIVEPGVKAIVAYADPNVGHEGYVYRAASWCYLGQCAEGRYYQDGNGQVVSRRKFHSGNKHLTKREILELGYCELKRPGKHRYVRPLDRWARKALAKNHPRWLP